MPLFVVELVAREGEAVPPTLAADLADALGEAVEAPPGAAWVRLHVLPVDRYAESGAGGERYTPVFVTLTAAAPPAGEALEGCVARLTQAVARVAGRPPENVHVIVDAPARGRVAFGGRLVR